MILQRDMQMIKVIKVADNLFQVLLRIPDEMETELTGLFTLEYRFCPIMCGYFRQHLFERDIVIDHRLYSSRICIKGVGMCGAINLWYINHLLRLLGLLLLVLPHDVDSGKGHTRNEENANKGGGHL